MHANMGEPREGAATSSISARRTHHQCEREADTRVQGPCLHHERAMLLQQRGARSRRGTTAPICNVGPCARSTIHRGPREHSRDGRVDPFESWLTDSVEPREILAAGAVSLVVVARSAGNSAVLAGVVAAVGQPCMIGAPGVERTNVRVNGNLFRGGCPVARGADAEQGMETAAAPRHHDRKQYAHQTPECTTTAHHALPSVSGSGRYGKTPPRLRACDAAGRNWTRPACRGLPHPVPGNIAAEPMMGSEDFGVFGRAAGAPSVQLRIGVIEPGVFARAKEAGLLLLPGMHSPQFAPDKERTIRAATAAMTLSALEVLGK